MPKTLTPAQVAELLQTSVDRVTDLVRSGELAAIDIGAKGAKRRTWRIAEDELARWLASRSTTPRTRPTPRRKRSIYTATYY